MQQKTREEKMEERKRNKAWWKRHKWLYIFLIPGILHFIVFKYAPMYGVIIAFYDFSPVKGIWGSEFVGWDNFRILFQSDNFWKVFRNSLWISILQIVWGFPVPVILALVLNELRMKKFSRFAQTVLYMPHFISWVVLAGIVINLLSPANGPVNNLLQMCGGESIAFLQSEKYFRSILVSTNIWKEAGWGAIVYIAAISGIDTEMFDAAIVDGATMLQKIRYITLPSIASTIIVLFILRMGSVLHNGFQQIYMLYTPLVYNVADVFETYTYRIGMGQGQFGFATAVGLFQSVVGLILVLTTNKISRKVGEGGLW